MENENVDLDQFHDIKPQMKKYTSQPVASKSKKRSPMLKETVDDDDDDSIELDEFIDEDDDFMPPKMSKRELDEEEQEKIVKLNDLYFNLDNIIILQQYFLSII